MSNYILALNVLIYKRLNFGIGFKVNKVVEISFKIPTDSVIYIVHFSQRTCIHSMRCIQYIYRYVTECAVIHVLCAFSAGSDRSFLIMIILIRVFGTVTKGLLKGQEDLEVRGRLMTIQTTALLRTARI